jgi:hypothetical protein
LGTVTAAAAITAKALTWTATAVDKTYDGTTTASGTTLSLSGFVGTEETTTATVDGSTFNDANVVGATTVTVNDLTLADGSGGYVASNYSLDTGQTASALIDAKAVLVHVDYQAIFFGENIPTLSYVASGLVNGDTLTGGLDATVGDPVEPGTFTIAQGTLTNTQNPNYSITFVDGQLTITMIPMAIMQAPVDTSSGTPKPDDGSVDDSDQVSEMVGIALPSPNDVLQQSDLN